MPVWRTPSEVCRLLIRTLEKMGTNIIFIAPCGKFMRTACCENSDHITNRGRRFFMAQIKTKLVDVRATMCDYILRRVM